ncbi:hypothetical protein ACIRVK_40375 [Streptomyces sp. NPDC101152]|uniref:hypothetical protein n=1 Tax=Streptomyces sp. NPDC101152 TaxID=3366116 RepID=UPI0037F318CA
MARQERQSSSVTLPEPLRNAASVLRKVPGAGLVSRATEGALDKVGAVSPRGRRMAVYAGAGVLGVAGVVEWPVAVTGAAVAWLTQPRPGEGGVRSPESEATAGDEGGTPAVEETLSTPADTEPVTAGEAAAVFGADAARVGPTPAHPGAEAVPPAPVTPGTGDVPPVSGEEAAPVAPTPAHPGVQETPVGPTPSHPGGESVPAAPVVSGADDVPGPAAPEPGAPGPGDPADEQGGPAANDRTAG